MLTFLISTMVEGPRGEISSRPAPWLIRQGWMVMLWHMRGWVWLCMCVMLWHLRGWVCIYVTAYVVAFAWMGVDDHVVVSFACVAIMSTRTERRHFCIRRGKRGRETPFGNAILSSCGNDCVLGDVYRYIQI